MTGVVIAVGFSAAAGSSAACWAQDGPNPIANNAQARAPLGTILFLIRISTAFPFTPHTPPAPASHKRSKRHTTGKPPHDEPSGCAALHQFPQFSGNSRHVNFGRSGSRR